MGCACCLGGLCCNTLCSLCGSTQRIFARIGHVIFGLVWVVVSLVVLHYGWKYLTIFNFIMGCKESEMEACMGITAVYRISFALAVFHLLMFFLCLCKSEVINAINEGAWPLKFCAVGGLFVLTWFMPNSLLTFYMYLVMIASVPFLIYEMILLIDMAYTWNRNWVEHYSSSSEGQSCIAIVLIISTLLLYISSIVLLVWLFISDNNFWQILVILFTVLAGICYTTLSLSALVNGGSLFTCGLILLFTSFMCMSVVRSNPTLESKQHVNGQTALGLGFLFVTLFYVSGTTREAGARDGDNNTQKLAANASDKVIEVADRMSESAESSAEITMPTTYFHLLLAFAAMHYALLLTNWGVTFIGDQVYTEFAHPYFGLTVTLLEIAICTFFDVIQPHAAMLKTILL